MAKVKPPVKIRPIHKLMAMARASGKSISDIAHEFEFSESWVRVVFDSPLIKELVRKYVDAPPEKAPLDAKKILQKYAPLFALQLIELSSDPDPSVRQRAIDSGLDRAGVGRAMRHEVAQGLPEADMEEIGAEIVRAKSLHE